jgi:hypothetical protein
MINYLAMAANIVRVGLLVGCCLSCHSPHVTHSLTEQPFHRLLEPCISPTSRAVSALVNKVNKMTVLLLPSLGLDRIRPGLYPTRSIRNGSSCPLFCSERVSILNKYIYACRVRVGKPQVHFGTGATFWTPEDNYFTPLC